MWCIGQLSVISMNPQAFFLDAKSHTGETFGEGFGVALVEDTCGNSR
jgi:hypothetical protein